jgi:phage head maturation protease
MQTRTITIELGERERKAAKDSKRFPASISSDTPITRRTWDGEWTEVLAHGRDAIDLSRAPLPLIEGHDRSRTNIGIVDGLRVEGGKLRGEVVFGSSARAVELAKDVADGIVRSLSVGYEILEQTRDEKKRRITATRWRPHECSVVATPADTTVGFGRSSTMDHEEQQTATTPPAPPTRAAAPSAEVLAERERISTIRGFVTRHHLGDAFADDLVTRGVPLADARALILERLAARDEQTRTEQHIRMEEPRITAGEDMAEDFHRAAVDSLLLRAGIRVEKPHAAARDVSASVYDLARTCLSRAGKSASRWFGGEARGPELIKRAATTSDFPLILSGALHASVRNGYETEPSSHRAWVRTAPFVDFKEAERPILGSAPELEKVLEHGEYPQGALDEDSTKYRVAKYGKIVSLSWELLVNDNLGAFLRVQPALGQAARRKEADLVYAMFAENGGTGPTMQDGVALFHAASHGNLVAAGAFDATLLGAGRTLLRKQTAVGGGYLSLVPRFLIVPPEREQAAEILLANASRRTTAEKATAEWISSLELVVEPRLASSAVYLAADSAQIDTIELGLLEENMSGPTLEEDQEFVRDEKRWKVRHVFGAKALDWRGMVQMPIAP